MTQCSQHTLAFEDHGSRSVTASFDGGRITSDAGGLLLREVEAKCGFIAQFTRCFTDHRNPRLIEHSLAELLRQRIFGLCLGYEDINDHDYLREDPLLALLVGKRDILGTGRYHPRDKGKPLAGKSTLNRLELTPVRANKSSRYKKIVAHLDAMQDFLVEAFVRQYVVPPDRLVLDIDATNLPLHGHQLGRFFHGYYDEYCYLPLYVFCGDFPLLALLRPANIDESLGARKQVARIVALLRRYWPSVRIVLRGDSGFCREPLLRWCEENAVDYVVGLAKNARLLRALGGELHQAKLQFEQTGQPARVFKDFSYRTQKSWSRARRVVGKAEHLAKGPNPRFIVSSLPAEEVAATPLYEQEYCGRGAMENRIKEKKLFLFADRVSCSTMRANQVRLCLSTVAYVLMRALREHGVPAAEGMPVPQCDTLRVRLLKLGAVVRVSVRRVVISLSQAWPWQRLFERVWENLRALVMPPWPVSAAPPPTIRPPPLTPEPV
jgi:hypothetical protein